MLRLALRALFSHTPNVGIGEAGVDGSGYHTTRFVRCSIDTAENEPIPRSEACIPIRPEHPDLG